MAKREQVAGDTATAKAETVAAVKQDTVTPVALETDEGQSTALARMLGVTAEAGTKGDGRGETGHEEPEPESDVHSQAETPETEDAEQAEEPEITEEPEERRGDAEKQNRVDKRIGKAVAKQKAAEEKLEALQAELEELKAAKAEQPESSKSAGNDADKPWMLERDTADRALATVRAKLRQLQSDPEAVAEWFKERKIAVEAYDAETMREHLEAVRDDANAVRAKAGFQEAQYKADWTRQEAQANAQAMQEYPWLKDKTSAEFVQFQKVLHSLPSIRQLPNWQFAAAVFVEGMNARETRLKAKGKPVTPVAKPMPKVPGASAAPMRPQGGEAEKSQAMKRLRDGDDAAMGDVLKTMLRQA